MHLSLCTISPSPGFALLKHHELSHFENVWGRVAVIQAQLRRKMDSFSTVCWVVIFCLNHWDFKPYILEKWSKSEESTVLEVFFDDNICNCIKHKFDVLCICSTSHVTVDFFDIFSHVEVKELTLHVIPCIFIRVVPWFSRKIEKFGEWTLLSCSPCFLGDWFDQCYQILFDNTDSLL